MKSGGIDVVAHTLSATVVPSPHSLRSVPCIVASFKMWQVVTGAMNARRLVQRSSNSGHLLTDVESNMPVSEQRKPSRTRA